MADSNEEERKREALRKAGQEYFEKVLAEASTGKDPFAAEPIDENSAKRAEKNQKDQRRAQRRQRPQKEDPDLEAVGAIISGARLYILTAVFVACTGVGLVFMKASLNPLETPGILTFLHMIAAIGVLFSFSGALEVDSVSLEGAKASLPCGLVKMIQMMMIFSSLLHGSIFTVVSFTMVVSELLRAAAETLVLQSAPSHRRQILCAAGLGSLVVVMLVDLLSGPLPPIRFWGALLLWSAAKAAEHSWGLVRGAPVERVQSFLGAASATMVLELSEAEEDLAPGTLALYQNLLPALPALILGFCGLEGNELVEHELSVPAVTAIILSICCFIGAVVSGVLLEPSLTPRLRYGLLFFAAILSVACATVGATGASVFVVAVAAIGAAAACACATLVHFLI